MIIRAEVTLKLFLIRFRGIALNINEIIINHYFENIKALMDGIIIIGGNLLKEA